jgi:hypothetical protein
VQEDDGAGEGVDVEWEMTGRRPPQYFILAAIRAMAPGNVHADAVPGDLANRQFKRTP